jgi:hypothetical protein
MGLLRSTIVTIRCRHLGVIAGLALALSVVAASDRVVEAPAATLAVPVTMQLAPKPEAAPAPAPVLFLAGGLFGLAALVRWRQKLGAWFGR